MKQFVLSKKKWIVTILTFILLSCAFIGVFLQPKTETAKAEEVSQDVEWEKYITLEFQNSSTTVGYFEIIVASSAYSYVGREFDVVAYRLEQDVDGVLFVEEASQESALNWPEQKGFYKEVDLKWKNINSIINARLEVIYTVDGQQYSVEREKQINLRSDVIEEKGASDPWRVWQEEAVESGFLNEILESDFVAVVGDERLDTSSSSTVNGAIEVRPGVIYKIPTTIYWRRIEICETPDISIVGRIFAFSVRNSNASGFYGSTNQNKLTLADVNSMTAGYSVDFTINDGFYCIRFNSLPCEIAYMAAVEKESDISNYKPAAATYVSTNFLEGEPVPTDSDLYFGTGSRVSSAGLDTVSNWLYLSADYVNNEYVEVQSIDIGFADVETAANCSLETQTFTLDQMVYDEVKGVYYMRIDVKTSAIGLPVKLQATLNYAVAGALTTYTVDSSERSTVQVLKALKEQGEFDNEDKIAEGGYSADYIATVNKLLDSYASGFGTSVENADYINIGTTFKANNENMIYRFDIVGQDEEWVKFFRTVNGAKTDVIKFNFTNGIITVDNAIESRLAVIPFEYWFGPTDVYFRFGFLDELQALETDGWYVVGSGYVNSVASIMHQSEKEALLAEIETLKAAKEAQVELARQKELEAEAAKAELAEAQSAAQAEINALKATILERESEIAELNAQIAANNITIAELNAQIVDLNNQITAKEKEIADLEAAGDASAQNIAKLVADLEALKLEKKKLQEEFDAFKLSADGDNTELLQLIADKNKEITKLKGEKKGLEEQNKELQADNDAVHTNGCAGQLNAGTAYTLILTLSVALIFMGVRYARKRKTDE